VLGLHDLDAGAPQPGRLRELDRRQAQCRAAIRAEYERVVTESMEALAACLGQALALDLVSADDFAPR